MRDFNDPELKAQITYIANKMMWEHEELDDLINECYANDNVMNCEPQFGFKAATWAIWAYRKKMQPFPAFDRSVVRGSGSFRCMGGRNHGDNYSQLFMEIANRDFYEHQLASIEDPEHRKIFEMRNEGYTYKEIAAEMGKTLQNAHLIYNKYLSKMKTKYRANANQ
jgi:hypothetical protein